MVREHICNRNLEAGVTKKHPRSGYDTPIKNQIEMIKYHTETTKSLEKLNADHPEDPEVKRKREEASAKRMQE